MAGHVHTMSPLRFNWIKVANGHFRLDIDGKRYEAILGPHGDFVLPWWIVYRDGVRVNASVMLFQAQDFVATEITAEREAA